MITISEAANKGLRHLMDQSGPYIGLRLVITGETPGAYMPEFMFLREGFVSPADHLVECEDLRIYIGPESIEKAKGLKIDVIQTEVGPRLKFEFPTVEWQDPVAQRLQELIDQRINPGLFSHGGYVALSDVHDGVAEVLMGGGCQGCALSAMTLSQGIEAIIKREIPEIHTVIDCTNHERGTNPYYPSAPPQKPAPPTYEENASISARRRLRRKNKS